MSKTSRSLAQIFAPGICLTFAAGWVDAVAFVSLSQIFVSVMSGNTTRLAIALAQTDRAEFVRYSLVIALFFIGVVIGESFAISGWRLRARLALVLDALLILLSIFLFEISFNLGCSAFLAMSMGLLNSCVREARGVPARAYVTGVFHQLGHATARYFRGELSLATLGKIAWVWLAFVLGGTAGAALTLNFNLGLGLILPAILIFGLAFFARRPA